MLLSDPDRLFGGWVFEFKMNKVSRRTATAAGWNVEVKVYDEAASATKC